MIIYASLKNQLLAKSQKITQKYGDIGGGGGRCKWREYKGEKW